MHVCAVSLGATRVSEPNVGFAPPDNLVLRLMEAGSDRVTTHSRSGARGLLSWRAAQGNIEGFATCWATGIVLRGVLFCACCISETTLGLRTAVTRTDKWNCAPSSPGPYLWATLMTYTRTGAALLAAFRTLNGPLRHSQTSKRQVRDAPEARSGVVAWAGSVVKRRPAPIGGTACGGVHCSGLTRS